ncbi:hypothetical protein Q9Q99_05860 [Curtobacterium flaccumfaciens]|nr:hypothetical protein Q9Q99_05860 [Curtobacterium flaccumfaciens]
MNKFGDFRETYLLERNALFTLYKNLGDEQLAAALPGSLALAVRRAVGRGELDSTELDLRNPGDDSVPTIPVPKTSMAGIYGVDQFVRAAAVDDRVPPPDPGDPCPVRPRAPPPVRQPRRARVPDRELPGRLRQDRALPRRARGRHPSPRPHHHGRLDRREDGRSGDPCHPDGEAAGIGARRPRGQPHPLVADRPLVRGRHGPRTATRARWSSTRAGPTSSSCRATRSGCSPCSSRPARSWSSTSTTRCTSSSSNRAAATTSTSGTARSSTPRTR